MKKIGIIIVVSIILIISIVYGIFYYRNKDKFNFELEIVTSIDYMVIKENNKFGVIDRSGNLLVEPIYDEIDIPNPSKPLFICMYNYNVEKQEYSVKVLNEKSEQILYEFIIVEAIKLNPAINDIPYEKSVLKYKKDGKYGLIDFNGNIIVKNKYEDIKSLDYKEGLLLVKKQGKYGVINIKGDTIIKTKYDIIESEGYYDKNEQYKKSGFIIGKLENNEYKYGYINYKGKKILDIKYNQIQRITNSSANEDIYIVAFENNMAGLYKNKEKILDHNYEDILYEQNNNCLILQKNSKQGISDFNGNLILDIKYDNIFTSGRYINLIKDGKSEFFDYKIKQQINLNNIIALNETLNSNYAIVINTNEKYQILNINSNEVKTKEYDYLEYISNKNFIACKNGKYGVIDISEKNIIDFKYTLIYQLPNSKILKCINEENNSTDLIIENEKIVSMKNASIYLYDEYIKILSEKEFIYISYDGKILKNTELFNKQLYAINKNGKWGFINKNNEIIVELQYDFVTEFNEYGFAGIKKLGKWGVINENGEIIIEPTYEIELNNPKFIGKYYKYNLGYGQPYYTN